MVCDALVQPLLAIVEVQLVAGVALSALSVGRKELALPLLPDKFYLRTPLLLADAAAEGHLLAHDANVVPGVVLAGAFVAHALVGAATVSAVLRLATLCRLLCDVRCLRGRCRCSKGGCLVCMHNRLHRNGDTCHVHSIRLYHVLWVNSVHNKLLRLKNHMLRVRCLVSSREHRRHTHEERVMLMS